MNEPSVGLLVERWLRKRDANSVEDPPFDLDSDGFLVDPHDGASVFNTTTNDDLLRPEVAAASGAVVLLGEPGLGKTTTFMQLASPPLDDPEPGEPGVVWVTGAVLADQGDLEERIGQFMKAWKPPVTPPDKAGPELTIVIDQLDESSLLAKGLVRRLKTILAKTNTNGLRILIACRTADCPPNLIAALEEAFGTCVVADLAPLTRNDATAIASEARVDGEACINSIVAAGAGGLGSVPLILKLFVDTFREHPEVLDLGAPAVFERGVTSLAEEWDNGRTGLTSTESTPDQRIGIAQRAAARLVLSGRRTIYQGKVGAASTDMTDSSLVSGTERMAGGSFDVTAVLVQETIRSSLFTSAGRDRISFRHSSVAAFLAASYLVAINTPRQQLEDLLLVAAVDESSSGIPTSLRETAAWLAELSPLHASWIVAADPEAIVAYSAYLTNSDTLAALVDGLLQRAEQIYQGPRSWQAGRWRLTHPGLHEQLLPVLEQAVGGQDLTDEVAAQVRLAVQLARDGAVTSLAQPLAIIAEQEAWPVSLRQRAARTAHELDSAATSERLKALLKTLEPQDAQPERDRDELAGTLLRLLWPDQLPVERVLPHLHRPASTEFHGAFVEALDLIPTQAKDEHLPSLLRELQHKAQVVTQTAQFHVVLATNESDISEDDDQDPDDPALIGSVPTTVVDKLIARCLASATPADYLDQVAKLEVPRLSRFERPSIPAAVDLITADGEEPEATSNLRRSFVISLIRQTLDINGKFGTKDALVLWQHWNNREPIFGWSSDDAPSGCHRAGRQHLLDNKDFE